MKNLHLILTPSNTQNNTCKGEDLKLVAEFRLAGLFTVKCSMSTFKNLFEISISHAFYLIYHYYTYHTYTLLIINFQ